MLRHGYRAAPALSEEEKGRPQVVALAATGVHTLAMLLTTGAVAVLVYEWVGVTFLRRGWINLDLVWTFALMVTRGLLLVANVVSSFPLLRPR